MAEITNANQVQLEVKALEGGTVSLTNRARMVVNDYNFTTAEDNQLLSGVGNRTPVGVTRGDVTHEFSFTIQGEDADVLEAVATEDGVSRIFELMASGRSFITKATECYLTEFAHDGTTGEATEWSVSGVVVTMDYHRKTQV